MCGTTLGYVVSVPLGDSGNVNILTGEERHWNVLERQPEINQEGVEVGKGVEELLRRTKVHAPEERLPHLDMCFFLPTLAGRNCISASPQHPSSCCQLPACQGTGDRGTMPALFSTSLIKGCWETQDPARPPV